MILGCYHFPVKRSQFTNIYNFNNFGLWPFSGKINTNGQMIKMIKMVTVIHFDNFYHFLRKLSRDGTQGCGHGMIRNHTILELPPSPPRRAPLRKIVPFSRKLSQMDHFPVKLSQMKIFLHASMKKSS